MRETEYNLEPASEKSVIMVSNILENYGFRKVEGEEKGHFHAVSSYVPFSKIKTAFPAGEQIEGVVDLFTVGGNFRTFKKTDLHKRYFDWYSKGVTAEKIQDIYKDIRKEFLLPDDMVEDKSI